MKVQNNKLGSSLKTDSAAGIKSSAAGSGKKTKGALDVLTSELDSSARVDLSERAQDVKKATDLARKGLNSVDEAKVSKYQALIDSGKYQVDSAKVADRMVDEQLANEFAAGQTKD